ncbi:hypothetical protein TTHERM_00723670 (macronuclear) [Tetrahymena thermophila SB210]|uniref:Uncharacterized protein n=1 Tax=Tetrahymena thermophila (strain SB210) TaxID=312017 RepID=I7MCL7_TETTS|nr:hypothetical protein TTHERM_00723670 [Tetrahymena thermophila SB210]EAR84182.2 hypothetical protein TTHERM_00723670 [Tetrahymena thermophila SB210]|eukprot:XP_001031845.2 hypothetical protein TTHERM_00723670 [Tetrahymena thermophila SB210]
MFSQFQKKVQNLEDGILEYVAKRQAQNLIKTEEKSEKQEKGYFDKLKDKIFKDEQNEQQSENKNNIMNKLKDRFGINDKDNNDDNKQKDNKKISDQIKTIQAEYSVKAKKYANDLGDQFNKLFNKKKTTPNKNEIQIQEQEEQKHPDQQDKNLIANNGWILDENLMKNNQNQNNMNSRSQNALQNQQNKNNRIFHNKYDDQEQESQDEISPYGSFNEQNDYNEQQDFTNQNKFLNNHQHNQNMNANRFQKEETEYQFQKRQITENQIPQRGFQNNQNNISAGFDRNYNENQGNQIQQQKFTKRRIFDDISQDNDSSFQQQQNRMNNQFEYKLQNQQVNQNNFENQFNNTKDKNNIFFQNNEQNYNKFSKDRFENSQDQINSYPHNDYEVRQFGMEQNQMQNQYNNHQLFNKEDYQFQQQPQRRRIFNNIDDSDLNMQNNSLNYNNNLNYQNNYYGQQNQQKSILEQSIVSSSAQKENLNELADVYFTSEYDYEKVLEYEINLHFGRTYPGMSAYEKKNMVLDNIENAVFRIEKLQNYDELVKEQIGENAMQNQHTLYMGTEMIKVVATVTDDTLGKVQKAKIKLQNYKILYAQRLKEINKLVKKKKRVEFVINFLQKFQLKYSSFIYSAKISVSINNIQQFEDLLVLLDSCNQQYLQSQQSQSLKVLKCLSNGQIYISDKLNKIYSILQQILTNELFCSYEHSPILRINSQPFNLEKYKYILKSYFILEKQFQIAIPLSKMMVQYVKKALDISVLRSFQNAQSYIEKRSNLHASQRFDDNFQKNQNIVNLNQLQYMTGEQYAESMKRIFHHITLLLFNLEQCQRFHSQFQSNHNTGTNTTRETDFIVYLKQLDQAIQGMKKEVSEAVLSKVQILILNMNLETYSNAVIDKIVVMISQMMLIVKEYDNDANLSDTIQVFKKILMQKLKSHADLQIKQLRKAILKDNWSRNKLPESYLNNLYFSLLRIQSKNEREGSIMHDQSKRIFNPTISVKAFTSQNRILLNYSFDPIFAEINNNFKPFKQISMKDPDDPIDDLDQTQFNTLQSSQNALFQRKAKPTINQYDIFQQDNISNPGMKMYESVKPEEQDEVGYCCQSAILLIECVHSYLQLMKYLTPIGYEIFLEVQKIIEFYFYSIFGLFIDNQRFEELTNTSIDVHSMSNSIQNIEKQINQLAPIHENLLKYLPYKELRAMIVRSIDYFECDNEQINTSSSQYNNNDKISQKYSQQVQQNQVNYADCNRDMNIFTLSCANNNYQINNINENNQMQGSIHKKTNNSQMYSSVATESSNLRRQKLMIQFDFQQRLSSVQSIYALNKYLQLVKGQIISHLSLIDSTSSVQNFVEKIINQEIQNYLKQMKNFIIRDYCRQQIEKENIFQDFGQVNWKPGDYTIDTQKPLYIDNSLYFFKEFKQKLEKDNISYNQRSANNQNNNYYLSPTVQLDIYRNILEQWTQEFLKNASSIKKYSEKGRSKLLNHYLIFLKEINQILPVGHLKIQNDVLERYIKIWNTTSAQELLEFILQQKTQIPLTYLNSIISSNDKLTFMLHNQKQYEPLNTAIYKSFLQFILENY